MHVSYGELAQTTTVLGRVISMACNIKDHSEIDTNSLMGATLGETETNSKRPLMNRKDDLTWNRGQRGRGDTNDNVRIIELKRGFTNTRNRHRERNSSGDEKRSRTVETRMNFHELLFQLIFYAD